MLTSDSLAAAPSLAAGLDVDTMQTVALIVVGVLVLLAVGFAFMMKAIVGKLISVAVLAALAIAVYLQRDNLSNCAKECACSFFGMELKISDPGLDAACREAVS